MNCPQCNSPISSTHYQSRLFCCEHCSAALLVAVARMNKGDLHHKIQEEQSLITQAKGFKWGEQYLEPIGFIRYEHENGYLTDWWVKDQLDHYWLSVDDEDFILSTDFKLQEASTQVSWTSLQLNHEVVLLDKRWLLVKKQTLSLYNQKGEVTIALPSTSSYLLTFVRADAMTLLVNIDSSGKVYIREGQWLDPFAREKL